MEKTNKKQSIMAIISAVTALAMILVVKVIAPVCSGMLDLVSGKQVAMKCHYTGVVIFFLGILLLVNAVVALVTKQGLACGIMSIVISAFVFVVLSDTLGIGICLKPEMACHTTAPLAKVCAIVEIIVGIVMCVFAAKKEK